MIGMSTKRRRQWRLRSDRHPLPRSVARRDLRKGYMTRLDFGLKDSLGFESLSPRTGDRQAFSKPRESYILSPLKEHKVIMED